MVSGAAEAAETFRRAAAQWTEVTLIARRADPAVEAACACSDRLDVLLRFGRWRPVGHAFAVANEKQEHIARCSISPEAAADVYAELAQRGVGDIAAIEATGLATISQE
ncbi:MAG: hypothetical protein R2706_13475 [Acidimicrobiales bacterium]